MALRACRSVLLLFELLRVDQRLLRPGVRFGEVVLGEEMEVFTLLLFHLARFEIGFEQGVGDGVDGHQPGGFVRLVLGIGAADHIQSAVDLRILDFMQEVMQLPEVLFVELARRKVGRELEVAVVMLLRRDFDNRPGVFGL